MPQPTRDLRIRRFRPLVPPAILLEEIPLEVFGLTGGQAFGSIYGFADAL